VSRPAPTRVGIVGGGIAGVCLAWLLDGACDVVLFERSESLGGHARTVAVEHRGRSYAVDVGAQIFSRALQPTVVRLTELLGVGTFAHTMGTTLGDHGAPRPRFVSPMTGRWWPLCAAWNLAGQWAFFQLARHARSLERDGDWAPSLDAWLRGLRFLGHEARERVVLPWLSALAGCSLEAGRRMSARAAIAVPARSLSDGVFSSFRYSHAAIGLGGVVELLASRCASLRARRGAGVARLERADRGYRIHAADGSQTLVDALVLAAPPHATRGLARDLGRADVAACLERFEYFRTRMVIHTDPVYAHADRRLWSAYNATTTDGYCEGSIWYGALRPRLDDGATVDVFKSWASARPREPRELLHEAEFLHPLISPEFVAAQERLATLQGVEGLWFAGSYCRDIDLQETAVRSAIAVAEALAPGARNLARLQPSAAGDGPCAAAAHVARGRRASQAGSSRTSRYSSPGSIASDARTSARG
jgi:predicted NAD/FAD-binding protein